MQLCDHGHLAAGGMQIPLRGYELAAFLTSLSFSVYYLLVLALWNR